MEMAVVSYLDRDTSGERAVSLVASLVVVGAIGYALVSGLTMNVVRTVAPTLKMVEITTLPPPPPKQQPPPPKKQEAQPTSPPIVAPPPIIRPPVTLTPSVVTVPTPPPAPVKPVSPAPPPPPAPKPNEATGVTPKGDPADWVTTDDYPPSAL